MRERHLCMIFRTRRSRQVWSRSTYGIITMKHLRIFFLASALSFSLWGLPPAAGAKEYIPGRTYLESVNLDTVWYPDFVYALSVMSVIHGNPGQNDFYTIKLLSPLVSGDDYKSGRLSTLVYWKQRQAVMLFTDDGAAWMASDAGIRQLYAKRVNVSPNQEDSQKSAMERNIASLLPHLTTKWRRITIAQSLSAGRCVGGDGLFNPYCGAKLEQLNEQRMAAETEKYLGRSPGRDAPPARDPLYRYALAKETVGSEPLPPPFTKAYGIAVRLLSSATGGAFSGISYEATLDDGTRIRGKTNENGYALIEASSPRTLVDFKAEKQIMYVLDETIPDSVPALVPVGLGVIPLARI